MKKFFTILAFLILANFANAHVALDYPVGGETFTAGDTVNIQWHILIQHNILNWDLYFSPDGGLTWQLIQLDIDPSILNLSMDCAKVGDSASSDQDLHG